MDRVKATTLREMKERGEKIVMLSVYDYPTARLAEEAGVDILLVGDSLGNVILGYPDTLSVTMDEMVHHTKAVSKAAKRALVVGDLPFMSYQASVADAVRNSGRFLKEGGAQAVKVEGGRNVLKSICAMVDSGIPVMGHLGLTPQWIHQFGGYKLRGKTSGTARMIIEDAKTLEKVGVFSIVLECMPWELAKLITDEIEIPTIGIGAGSHCDGQVLVLHDILGLSGQYPPKFVKQYAKLDKVVAKALQDFRREVKGGKFPTIKQSYEIPPEEKKKLLAELKQRASS